MLLLISTLNTFADETVKKYCGGEFYVPVYSQIFYGDRQKTINLAATLGVHNVSSEIDISVERVDYHGLDGKLIRLYSDKKETLTPFQTLNKVVSEKDRTGGTGANFIIRWSSEKPVVPPIVEAVQIGTSSSQGISFVTQGKATKLVLCK